MEKEVVNVQNFDLKETLTCGQTFTWSRTQGELYGNGEDVFYNFYNRKPVITWQKDNQLHIKTKADIEEVKKALGLQHSLENIFDSFPEDPLLEKAREKLWGLRIVQDEFFPCLISYLLSPQMRIPRIKEMYNRIAEEYGEEIEFEDVKMHRFPTPEELAKASEEELRDLGVGYRAEYIDKTTDILLQDFEPDTLRQMSYGKARKEMKKLYGVGNKVADCILLFSQGFYQAYPLDTWAKKAVKKHYPELHADNYTQTSENMRKYFGENSGYAQEYIFHAARKGLIEL
ncbi:MAG: DNA-3-methyladenine glycosylase [Candidatus Nanohalobium sp.]